MLIGGFLKNTKKEFRNRYFSGLSFNSADCKKDYIFFAIKGTKSDGSKFINDAIKKVAETTMKGVLDYDPEPKVSIDFNHDTHSSNFAPAQTKVLNKRLVRVLSWYDNEWGFSCRMADTAIAMGRLL